MYFCPFTWLCHLFFCFWFLGVFFFLRLSFGSFLFWAVSDLVQELNSSVGGEVEFAETECPFADPIACEKQQAWAAQQAREASLSSGRA